MSVCPHQQQGNTNLESCDAALGRTWSVASITAHLTLAGYAVCAAVYKVARLMYDVCVMVLDHVHVCCWLCPPRQMSHIVSKTLCLWSVSASATPLTAGDMTMQR
jgi:hypothetical protein